MNNAKAKKLYLQLGPKILGWLCFDRPGIKVSRPVEPNAGVLIGLSCHKKILTMMLHEETYNNAYIINSARRVQFRCSGSVFDSTYSKHTKSGKIKEKMSTSISLKSSDQEIMRSLTLCSTQESQPNKGQQTNW